MFDTRRKRKHESCVRALVSLSRQKQMRKTNTTLPKKDHSSFSSFYVCVKCTLNFSAFLTKDLLEQTAVYTHNKILFSYHKFHRIRCPKIHPHEKFNKNNSTMTRSVFRFFFFVNNRENMWIIWLINRGERDKQHKTTHIGDGD